MNLKILKFLQQSSRPRNLTTIAQNTGFPPMAVMAGIMNLRRAGQLKTYGCGCMTMRYFRNI